MLTKNIMYMAAFTNMCCFKPNAMNDIGNHLNKIVCFDPHPAQAFVWRIFCGCAMSGVQYSISIPKVFMPNIL